MKTNAPQ